MRWNLKEAGYWEHTDQWANLWSDEQKLHQAMHVLNGITFLNAPVHQCEHPIPDFLYAAPLYQFLQRAVQDVFLQQLLCTHHAPILIKYFLYSSIHFMRKRLHHLFYKYNVKRIKLCTFVAGTHNPIRLDTKKQFEKY